MWSNEFREIADIIDRFDTILCHVMISPMIFFVLVFRSFVISFLWLIYQYFTFSSVTSSHWLTLGVNQYFSMERLLIYFCVIYTLIYSYSKFLIFPRCLWVDSGLIGPADSRRKDLSPKFNKQLEFWIISASVLIYFLVGRVRRRPLLSCPDGVWEHLVAVWHDTDDER